MKTRLTAALAIAVLLLGCGRDAPLAPVNTGKDAAGDAVPVSHYHATKNVIIVIMDGVRCSEFLCDASHAYVPRIASHLMPLGTAYANTWVGGLTETNAGHASLVTGFYERISNWGKELPAHPTIFQLFRKISGADPKATWVVTSKGKLAVLADSADPAWRGRYTASTDCGQNGAGVGAGMRTDEETLGRALEILKRDHPRLALVSFAGPDSAGHSGSWEAYLDAIRAVDGYTTEIWKLVQADPVYAGKTALLVTNDHGRHCGQDFSSHGDGCDCCRHINLVAVGPDFPAGAVVEERVEQVDVPVTVAHLLGFSIVKSGGKVLPGTVRGADQASR